MRWGGWRRHAHAMRAWPTTPNTHPTNTHASSIEKSSRGPFFSFVASAACALCVWTRTQEASRPSVHLSSAPPPLSSFLPSHASSASVVARPTPPCPDTRSAHTHNDRVYCVWVAAVRRARRAATPQPPTHRPRPLFFFSHTRVDGEGVLWCLGAWGGPPPPPPRRGHTRKPALGQAQGPRHIFGGQGEGWSRPRPGHPRTMMMKRRRASSTPPKPTRSSPPTPTTHTTQHTEGRPCLPLLSAGTVSTSCVLVVSFSPSPSRCQERQLTPSPLHHIYRPQDGQHAAPAFREGAPRPRAEAVR